MLIYVTWTAYVVVAIGSALLYYGGLFIQYRRSKKRDAPSEQGGQGSLSPPQALSLDQILDTLEETILNAQRKRYHPDEILSALRQKVAELKAGSRP